MTMGGGIEDVHSEDAPKIEHHPDNWNQLYYNRQADEYSRDEIFNLNY